MTGFILFLLVFVGIGYWWYSSNQKKVKQNEFDIVAEVDKILTEAQQKRNAEATTATEPEPTLLTHTRERSKLLREQLEESLLLAHNSTNPETKVSRLEFSRAKVQELASIGREFPELAQNDLAEIQDIIYRMTKEFSDAGYYAEADVSVREYQPRPVAESELWRDVLKGWKYCATMQLRTPLRVLEMHGRVWPKEDGDPPSSPMGEGVWTMLTKSMAELGVNRPDLDIRSGTMASEIGPIPNDGGDFLRFLKSVRRIVERFDSIEDRRSDLRVELARPEWAEIIGKIGGKEDVYDRFFVDFLFMIPELSSETRELLWEQELTTPAKLAAKTDMELLAINGIGPAKLKLIRQACEEAADKDAELVDRVNR